MAWCLYDYGYCIWVTAWYLSDCCCCMRIRTWCLYDCGYCLWVTAWYLYDYDYCKWVLVWLQTGAAGAARRDATTNQRNGKGTSLYQGFAKGF